MKPSLSLRAAQHLALTPQLQQSIRLLQMSTAELEEEIEKFIAENPLLELMEGSAAAEAREKRTDLAPEQEQHVHDAQEEQLPGSAEAWASSPARSAGDDGDMEWASQRAQPTSLRDHLHEQAMGLPLSERDRVWLDMLIDSLDDDGYLREPLQEIEAVIAEPFEDAFGVRLDADEMTLGLRLLQSMEPTGVGARSLSECLMLQLAKETSPAAPLALTLAKNVQCLELLARRDFTTLCKKLQCNRDELKAAQLLIQSLNPRPGIRFQANESQTVIPDVIAFKASAKKGGGWQVRLNESAIPRLTVNPLYADLIRQDRANSMTHQLQEARWVIKNIQQRFDTILRVAQAIAQEQQLFFEEGALAMRPLVLREIAHRCELHESTVSRVTTNKYILTPKGTFELKYFFTSHVGTDTGGTASSTAIRAKLKQWIDQENPQKPFSDQQLADRFAQEGINVARRTIAKYREALRIEPVSQRKKL
jgi:RNA polymerase sigma-54 factor